MSFFDELVDVEITEDQLKDLSKPTEVIKPGKYHVMLDGSSPKTAGSGNEGTELTFKILSGPFAEREVKETLWHAGNNEAATKKMKGRMIVFGAKLGILKKNAAGSYVPADGKRDFSDVLGAECVIEVTNEEYEKKGGGKGIATRMTWAGIWRCDEPDARGVVKKSATSEQKAAPAKSSAKKFDPSEL